MRLLAFSILLMLAGCDKINTDETIVLNCLGDELQPDNRMVPASYTIRANLKYKALQFYDKTEARWSTPCVDAGRKCHLSIDKDQIDEDNTINDSNNSALVTYDIAINRHTGKMVKTIISRGGELPVITSFRGVCLKGASPKEQPTIF